MVRIIGHRGASGYRPEHSEAAYRLAFDMGVDAVEPDLVASADGVLVIRHENNIADSTDVADRAEFADRRRVQVVDGETVDGWFTEDFTWEELATLSVRERIPHLRPGNTGWPAQGLLRFADLLEMLNHPRAHSRSGKPTELVAEIKLASHFAAVGWDLTALAQEELVRAGWGPDDPRLYWESFEPEPLEHLEGWGRRILLLDETGETVLAERADNYDGLSVPLTRALKQPDLAQRVHERHRELWVWTLRPENAFLPRSFRSNSHPADWGDWAGVWTRLQEMKVDAVFVDHPDLLTGVGAGS